MDTDVALDEVLFALADPTRRAIVEQLMRGSCRVGELRLPRRISPSTLSKHLMILRRAGLLTQTADGPARVCRIDPAPLRAAAAWFAPYRRPAGSQRAALERYFGLSTDSTAPSAA